MSTVGQTTKNASTALARQQHEGGVAANTHQSRKQEGGSEKLGTWQKETGNRYPFPPEAAAKAKSDQDSLAKGADVNQTPANISARGSVHFALSHHSGMGHPAPSHWEGRQIWGKRKNCGYIVHAFVC